MIKKLSIILVLGLLLLVSCTSAAVSQYNTTSGSYTIIIFNGTGSTNWVVPSGVSSVEYLVVAGGGGGGGLQDTGYGAGGGGAGGFRTATGYLANGTISITVGAGGEGGPYSSPYRGYNGSNSVFGDITSIGGGGGGAAGNGNPLSNGSIGGSGGGAGTSSSFASGVGAGTAGQGNAGGLGVASGDQGGGGGGANNAGQAGQDVANIGGMGGNGTASTISGSSITYAGGGGGSVDYSSGVGGNGGLGGGGAGAGYSTYAINGTDGLGGGGGAGGGGLSSTGGKGGSGVVIIKYFTPGLNDTWYANGSCYQLLNQSTGDTIIKCNTTGTYNWTAPLSATGNAKIIVVAGGGGGANGNGGGGGGGAGGLVYQINRSLVAGTNYSITIGSGGTGGVGGGATNGVNGDNSTFADFSHNITANGGGGGGAGLAGLSGGSGGGGGFTSNNGGVTNQPNSGGGNGFGSSGGAGSSASNAFGGGGGGGASSAGAAGTTSVGGNGGAGLIFTNMTFENISLAGGGGGGTNSAGYTAGIGWNSIGGNGGAGVAATVNGTNGTGSGGGGGGSTFYSGTRGGSGIIIIRYQAPAAPISSFTSNTSSGTSPLALQFNDTSSNIPTSWNWSFTNITPGNNTETWFSTTQNPVQVFGIGNYSIKLNSSNSLGYNITPGTYFVNISQFILLNDTWYANGSCYQLINQSTGDTIVKCNTTGTYNYTIPANTGNIWYLVVAGGGAGGGQNSAGNSGGGGAGGLLNGTLIAPPSSGIVYNITVGTGGINSTAASKRGGNGTNSSFGNLTYNLTSVGGGGGGIYTNNYDPSNDGSSGGSGGGSSQTSSGYPSGGSNVSGQGWAGGNSTAGLTYSGGGGGGAGEVGKAPTDTNGKIGGKGGNGTLITISGCATYYAGGGSGSSHSSGSTNPGGGLGGGGTGKYGANIATKGLNETGGGGGGGGENSYYGANGGNGVVYLRYNALLASAPISSFTSNTTNGTSPLTVQFNDTSSNTPTAWSWSFQNVTGNNTQVWFSTTQNPVQVFGIGNYSIKLNTSNSGGYNITPGTYFVNVSASSTPDISQIPNFSCSPNAGQKSVTTFACTDTSSIGYKIDNWSWQFGDSNTSTTQNPTFTYPSTNSYSITLTIYNTTYGFSSIKKWNYISTFNYNITSWLTGDPQWSSDQTDYVIPINVYSGSGVSSGSNIYLNGSGLRFPSDFRVNNADNTITLSQWADYDNSNSTYIRYYVKVPTITKIGNTNLNIYYGNNLSYASSNITATFPEGSDFDRYLIYNQTAVMPVGILEQEILQDPTNPLLIDQWYGDNSGTKLYYTNSTDPTLRVWGTPVQSTVPDNVRFPYIIYDKTTSKWYLFSAIANGGSYNIYLYNSTDKVTWVAMNGGNPVLTHNSDTASNYYYIWNLAIWINGSTWHMLVESDTQAGANTQAKLLYSYSTLSELNWTAHINSTPVITYHGNPELKYIPEKNALLCVAGNISTGTWFIDAYYTDVSSGLSSTNIWTKSNGFEISKSGIHITDPTMIISNTSLKNNINIIWMDNQGSSGSYLATSDLSTVDFFDAIKTDDISGKFSKEGGGTPSITYSYGIAQITGTTTIMMGNSITGNNTMVVNAYKGSSTSNNYGFKTAGGGRAQFYGNSPTAGVMNAFSTTTGSPDTTTNLGSTYYGSNFYNFKVSRNETSNAYIANDNLLATHTSNLLSGNYYMVFGHDAASSVNSQIKSVFRQPYVYPEPIQHSFEISPTSNFTSSVTSGTTPLTVQFNDTSANTPTAWNWSFQNVTGNNTQVWFSTTQNATQVFGIGNYSIKLNTSNSVGYNITPGTYFVNASAIIIINDTWYANGSCYQLLNQSTGDTLVKCNTTGTYNWTAPTDVTNIQYLVVAGGGGGGGSDNERATGGGGAGGVLNGTISIAPSTLYNINIGAGGNGGITTGGTRGGNGTNSSFSNVTYNISARGGGGGGGTGSPYIGADGGSGGGAYAENSRVGGTGTVGQGQNGGNGYESTSFSGGGGGGNATAGAAGSGSQGGNGGIGFNSNITGSSIYYAGGGGGGSKTGTAGSGGTGGGGNGALGNPNPGNNATSFGSGGGGSGGGNARGGYGYNGIVIIRYNTASTISSPVSSFTSNTTNGTTSLTVQFNDTSSNTPTAWNWSFTNITPGNNTETWFSTTQNPVQVFGIGNYSIKLNSSNSGGYNITPGTYFVNVSAVSPGFSNDTWYASGSCYYMINQSTNNTIVKCNTTGSYNWTIPSNVGSVQYLVVAGGGGGGSNSGGGGAGGLLAGNTSVTPGTIYNISIGFGGNGGAGGNNGANGGNSSFANTTIGNGFNTNGGGGGGGNGANGVMGGSGGGAGAFSSPKTGGSNVSGQGFAGGNTVHTSGSYPAAGGGGAGSTGYDTLSTSTGGNGGSGKQSNITGYLSYYAGGGGGGAQGGGNAGTGGSNIGGNASVGSTAKNGTNETGSGGGGAGWASSVFYTGGNGGTGIVILRYSPAISPISNFTSNVSSGTSPLTVQFNDTSSNTPTSWNWSFTNITPGNNTQVWFSTTQNPVQVFGIGNYSIKLNSSNLGGFNITPGTYFVNVSAAVTHTFDPKEYGNFTDFIVNSTSALTDFQIKMVINNTTGYASTVQFYTNGTTRTDWIDIAWANASTNSSLSFWKENGTETNTSSTWWIKVPSISNSNTTKIRMFYGNSSQVTPFSNGYSTFTFFDDFDSAVVNSTQWTITNGSGGSTSQSSGVMTFTVSATTGYPTLTATTDTVANNLIWESRVKHSTSASASQFENRIQGNANPGLATAYQNDGSSAGVNLLNSGVAWGTRIGTYSVSTYGILSSAYDGTNLIGWWNRANKTSWARTATTQHGSLAAYSASSNVFTVDWVLERQYTSTEPFLTVNTSQPSTIAPISAFTSSVTYGTSPLTVQFNDASSNTPTAWNWSFTNITPGNNTQVWFNTTQNPIQVFGVGNYSIKLNSSNSGGYNITPGTYFVNVSENTWYSTYKYRQLHTIDGDVNWTGNQINYQVLFTVYNSSGVSSGGVAYTNGSTSPEWSDIRFTSTSGSLYDYWIETTNISSAKIWVEIPLIYNSTSLTQMYMYYNKSMDISAENGTATFILFDDFNNGTTLDTSRWTAAATTGSGGVSVANGNLTLSGYDTGGGTSSTAYIYSSSTYSAPYQLVTRFQYTSDWTAANNVQIPAGTHNHMSSTAIVGTSNGYRMTISDTAMLGANIQEWSGSWTTTQTAYALSKNTWYHHTDSLLLSGSNNIKLQEYNESGGILVTAQTSDTTRTSGYIALINANNPVFTRNDGIYDWVFIKNYADTEPSHSTWYATEYNDITISPESNFTSSVTSGLSPLTVQFSDLSLNNPTAWNWSFTNITPGNNTQVWFNTTQNPIQVFGVGNYSIKLNSSNSGGYNITPGTYFVNVSNMTPDISLSSFSHNINITTFGTTNGSQTNYNIPIFVTTGNLSSNLNTLDQGMVVEDNFTQWLNYTLPIRRYSDMQQPIIGTNSSSTWSDNQVNDQVFLIDGNMIRCYYEGVQYSGGAMYPQGVGVASVSISDFLLYGQKAIWTVDPSPIIIESHTIRVGTVLKVTNASSSTGVTYYLYTAEPVNHSNDINVYMGETYNNLTRVRSDIISLGAGEDYAQNPAVIREDATTWKMYYDVSKSGGSGWAVDVATSSNGITWTRVGQVFTTGQGWDNQKIEHIHAMKVNDTYVVTYEAANDASYSQWSTGIAYSTDFDGTFTKYANNPILSGDRSDITLLDYGHVATPTWIKINNIWYYSVCGNPHTTGWANDWGIEIFPASMPAISVNGVKDDFSDIRFSVNQNDPLQQGRIYYESGKWAKIYVQRNTSTPTYDSTNVAASSNGASATASSTYSGSSASNAIDENYATEWRSNSEGSGAWINITMSGSKNIGKIVIHGSSTSGSGIMTGRILFSDGSVERFGNVPNPGSNTVFRTVEFPARSVSWFKVISDSPMIGTTSRFMEIRAYEWTDNTYKDNTTMYYQNSSAPDIDNQSIFISPPNVLAEPYFTYNSPFSEISPIASFTSNTSSGISPLTVQFDDASSNTPTAWNWSFTNITPGNNTQIWFSTTQNPVQVFEAGNFSIKLNSSNSGGYNITPGAYFINVSASPTPLLNDTWYLNGSCYQLINQSTGDTIVKCNTTGMTNWTAPSGVNSVWYLVVAGGGSGGGQTAGNNGGGGAGGLLNGTMTVTSGVKYNISVGNGGATQNGAANGNNGANSSFANTTKGNGINTLGGGGGAKYDGVGRTDANAGGSGGGGGQWNTIGSTGGSGVSGQGYKGGDAVSGGIGAAGGGGASIAGSSQSGATGGKGGNGTMINITGNLTYYAGGGSGSTHSSGSGVVTGGLGGGGNGHFGATVATAGANELGGGGGGGGESTNGAAGGSGIVIIRYNLGISPISNFTSNITSGTPLLSVQFTDASSNTPSAWNWSFQNVTGNNTQVWFSTTQNPVQVFGIGNYSIKLNSSNSVGYNITPGTYFVNVTSGLAPVSSFITDVYNATPPLSVQFNDTSSNTPTAWNWSFQNVTGNNTQVWFSTTQNTTLILGVGNYSIRLNSSNTNGFNISTQTTFINISEMPTLPQEYLAYFNLSSNVTLTNFQVKLILSNSTGYSSTPGLFYTNGTTRSDWADILFTDTSNTTIGFWIENHTQTSTNITVWVKAPSILNSNTSQIWLHYGNNTNLSSYNNGTNTFLLFDDFNNGTTLDTSKWTATGSATVSNGNVTIVGSGSWAKINGSLFLAPVVLETRSKFSDTYSGASGNSMGFNNAAESIVIDFLHYNSGNNIRHNPTSSSTSFTNTMSRYTLKASSGDGTTSNFYENDTELSSSPVSGTDFAGTSLKPTFNALGSSSTPLIVDWMALRKYSVNEPTITNYPYGSGIPQISASFTSSVSTIFITNAITFTDTSTGSPTSWNWSFGEGNYNITQNPSYTYTSSGIKTITLNASNNNGFNITSNTVTISDFEPVPNFTRYSTILTAPPESWLNNVVGEPTVLYDTNPQILNGSTYVYKMWYSGGWASPALGYAESTNGINWTRYSGNPLTMPINRNFVIKNNGTYYCYGAPYGDTRIDVYTSPNGINWTSAGIGVVTTGTGWEADAVANTFVWVEDGTWYILYDGLGSGVWSEGLATSTNGINWTKYGGNPVISATGTRGSVGLLPKNGSVYSALLLGSQTGGLPTDLYKYDSLDLHTWYPSPVQPWMNRTGYAEGEGLSTSQLGDPYVLVRNNTWYLYYDYSRDGTTNGGDGASIAISTTHGLSIDGNLSPVSNFTSNTSSGTSPLTVQFNDTSSNTPTAWNWSFTNITPGNNTQVWFSTTQNATQVFGIGNYSIKLNSSNSGGYNITPGTYFVNTSAVIIVLPIPDFNANITSGIGSLPVKFTDSSITGISSWNWTFGDGNYSNTQSPTFTYNVPGTYSVTLNVTNASGYNSTTKIGYIVLTESIVPVPDFSANATSGIGSLPVQFTDNSITSISSWNWSFGDGNYSNSANPKFTYNVPGTYSVRLNVTNASGYNSTTKTGYITLTQSVLPIPIFSANVTSGIGSLPVQFTDNSITSISSWNWSFGDGNYSNTQNPLYVYTSNGMYSVKLNVTNASGYNTTTKSGYITITSGVLPIPNFTTNTTYGPIPLTVDFLASSVGVTAWNWSFGDGTFYNGVSYVKTYNSAGSYTIVLTVQNASGVNSTTKTNYITAVPAPFVDASFSASPTSAAQTPASVSFYDTSSGTSIDTWNWDFGDGSTSSSQNPTHTYSSVGLYTVRLTASSSSYGVTDTQTCTQCLNINNAIVPGGYNFTSPGTIDIVNSSGMEEWMYYMMVTNKTGMWSFPVIGFATGIMKPFTSAFESLGGAGTGNIVYLILWGLFIMMVWRNSGKVTIPALIGVVTAGAWSLLFPESAQPWVLILLAGALASQLLTFFAKE